jgi:hypothetical protein
MMGRVGKRGNRGQSKAGRAGCMSLGEDETWNVVLVRGVFRRQAWPCAVARKFHDVSHPRASVSTASRCNTILQRMFARGRLSAM